MAMTDAGMSAAIKSALEALIGTPENPTELQNFTDALGRAIVEYIKANAVVTSAGTVTSGGGAGETVATTGTVS